jgi:protein SCO1/2
MPAMTMPFTMGTGVDAGALRPGDRVRFALRVDQAASEAHSLVVTGRDEAVAAASMARPAAPASRLRRGDVVPPFTLRDQDDRDFATADLEGQLTLVTFIFTRCPLPEFCPLMVKRFREVQAEVEEDATLGERTRLLSVTLDPVFDTPQRLHAYGTAMKADFARWRFVTGTPEAIDAFAKAFAVYTEWSGASLDHTLATALIGPDGRVLEIWRGNGWKTDEVLAALRAAGGT